MNKNETDKVKKDNTLEKFLIWELIDLHREQGSKDFGNIVKSIFDKLTKANRKFFFVKYFDYLYNSFHSFSKKRVFFKGDRFKQFVAETKKDFPVGMIVSGINDRIYAIKNLIPYISISHLYKHIDEYFKTGKKEPLRKAVSKMERLLRNRDINSIVLWNDCFPLDRALIAASRTLKIPTIQIQVGMHISTCQPENGREADFVFVWGDFFKEMYSRYKIRSTKKIYTLGYPRKIKKYPAAKKIKKVIYLGQNIEKFNVSLFNTKIETIKELNKICKKEKLLFKYRPHPNDDIRSILKEIPNLTLSQGPLETTFEDADVLVSLFSTALIEGAMAGKICIQLANYPMNVGNFERLGICKSFMSLNNFEKYLAEIVINLKKGNSFKFNPHYISQPKCVEKDFVKLLKKVLKNV